MASHRLYNANDLQNMISLLVTNPVALDRVCIIINDRYKNRYDYMSDRDALMYVIQSGSVESFGHFDSDVREQFVSVTEKAFGRNWHEKGIQF